MTTPQHIHIGGNGTATVVFGNNAPLSILAGTCAIEGRDITFKTAETLKEICTKLGIGLVYKGSFDKANRTSVTGARGIGLENGLRILEEVRTQLQLPVVTDVHEIGHVVEVGAVVDVVQIPAFLSRQTDLLIAAAKTGKVVNIKKAQFMHPRDAVTAAEKVRQSGNPNIMLTERGTTFGYNNLVVDYRGFPQMAESGLPVLFDATHSVMEPSAHGNASGGRREFVVPLSRAAIGMGVAGLFMETHPDPTKALSDKETQMPLAEMAAVLAQLKRLDDFCKAG
ncbi:MAG: 3-deoxy-8-phosphooctulonate synthase [Alphaproteobacteria bacterium]